MINNYENFRDYIYDISREMIDGVEYVDTSWLQKLIPINILTEIEAIKYVYEHQELVGLDSNKICFCESIKNFKGCCWKCKRYWGEHNPNFDI
jgi:hypothetical protein